MERAAYSPPQKNNAAWMADLKSGNKMALGCAINSSSTLVAELVAATGYDFCLIDAQHSAIDTEKVRCMLQAVHAGGAKAWIRVGGCYDRIGIQQAFDLGADGILVPCAQTVEDVKHAVSCAKYPVSGPGSVGGTRSVYLNLRPQLPGGFPSLFDYVTNRGNAETMMAFQIETASALKCVDEICAVPGVDIAFIGPGDLATDMGLVAKVGMPACWGTPEFAEAEKKVAAACKANGVVAGYWNADLKTKGALGFRFFVANGDLAAMQQALASTLEDKKKEATEFFAHGV
uniref:HpcH/HpaI aldolase/citrate lyase domain-containing protein n=1 Tax=Haptolina brevifila TaxID=156173 RepID=A0A7S2FPK8_9EUKA